MELANNEWIKIAASEAELPFGVNGIAEIEVQGKRICVAHHLGTLYAFSATCPHASGRFAAGFIDGLGNVVCPLHRYRFCLRNGHNTSGEGYYLKHWLMKHDKGVFVKF